MKRRFLWLITIGLGVAIEGCTFPPMTKVHVSCTDCRPIEEIEGERFTKDATSAGGGCIAHVFPEKALSPPKAWNDYLRHIKPIFRNTVSLIFYVGLTNRDLDKVAEQRSRKLWAVYRQMRVPSGDWRAINNPIDIIPSYESLCGDLPVLELLDDGFAHRITRHATSPINRTAINDLANRTILVRTILVGID